MGHPFSIGFWYVERYTMLLSVHPSILIHFEIRVLSMSSHLILGMAAVAALSYVGHQRSMYLSCQSTPDRPLSDIILHTCKFRGLSLPSLPSRTKSVTDLIQDVARCTCLYHLSEGQLWRPAVVSSMPSFLSSEAEGVSSRSLVPQIQQIIKWSVQWNRCRSEVFSAHVSQLWSIAEWMQVL